MDRVKIDKLWSDKANWTWGIIYRCRQDPRVIVPRRWKWGGWTFNFDHPRVGIAGLAAMGLAVGPGLLALLLFDNRNAVFLAMIISVAALISWAHWESNRTS